MIRGSENGNAVVLKNFQDLVDTINDDINNESKGEYELAEDFDCRNFSNFTPLGGGNDKSFLGTLDGKGYAIQNLTIYIDRDATNYLGFFSQIGISGEVKNLRFDNITFASFSSYKKGFSAQIRAGVIAAVCSGKITNCFANGSITVQTDRDDVMVGGLCGEFPYKSSAITTSCANVNISFIDSVSDERKLPSSSDSYGAYKVGGICGNTNGSIIDCHSRSNITLPQRRGTAKFLAGGICGYATANATITSCYNIGYLLGGCMTGDSLGGIVGDAEAIKMIYKNYYLSTFVSYSNNIGVSKLWQDMVARSFLSELSIAYDYTPVDTDNYNYTPHLKSLEHGKALSETYMEALCTLVVTSFSQSPYPESTNPVTLTFKLDNCDISDITVIPYQHYDDKYGPEYIVIPKNKTSFSYDMGNNKYIAYEFKLTLNDKFKRNTIYTSPKLALPHIENPSMNSGRQESWAKLDQKKATEESVKGITPTPGVVLNYSYENYHFHWVGNNSCPPKYYAYFIADISGATCFEVRTSPNETIAEVNMEFSAELEQYEIRLRDLQSNYGAYNKLLFYAISSSGTASMELLNNKEYLTPNEGEWPHALKRLVWSMTNRCNLQCKHCFTRDIHSGMEELCELEVNRVTEDIVKLGVSEVCLSGGEILLSPYWSETASKLSKTGILVTLITNGTLVDATAAKKIKESGVAGVAISIDDASEQIDTIRDPASRQKAIAGVRNLKAAGIPVSIITTINAKNISLLSEMRQEFTEIGADVWGIKPILPIGEANRNKDALLLDERDISKIIDFCYFSMETEGLPMIPHAEFEKHTEKGAAILRSLYGDDICTDFYGSDGGIFSAQLHPDGNMVGLCSCSPLYSMGNVKERSIVDIWRDRDSFKALRNFDPDKLEGFCGECDRHQICKGGDVNTRMAFGGLNAENKYCAYRNYVLYGIEV